LISEHKFRYENEKGKTEPIDLKKIREALDLCLETMIRMQTYGDGYRLDGGQMAAIQQMIAKMSAHASSFATSKRDNNVTALMKGPVIFI
jgi:hypothetical protein